MVDAADNGNFPQRGTSLSLSLDSHAQTNPLKVIITDIISIKAFRKM